MPENIDTVEDFQPQSWLSARTGLDRHPALRLQIDTIAHQIFTAGGPLVAKSLLDLIGHLIAHIPNLHPADHSLIIDVAAAGLGKVLDAQGISVDSPATPTIIGDIAAAVTDHAPKAAPAINLAAEIALVAAAKAAEDAKIAAEEKAAEEAAEEAAAGDAKADADTSEKE